MKANKTRQKLIKMLLLAAIVLFAGFSATNCSSTKLAGSWRNANYANYTPKKVLILGVSQNLTARKIFEEELAKELSLRGIQSGMAYDIFPVSFTNSQQSEIQIQREIDTILNLGYDSVLISAVKGVDEKVTYDRSYGTVYYRGRFNRYYYTYQDIYYTPYYYEKYKVYHIESSLFDLETQLDKTSLIWTASFDLVDPYDIENSVQGYIKGLLKNLEKEGLIPKI